MATNAVRALNSVTVATSLETVQAKFSKGSTFKGFPAANICSISSKATSRSRVFCAATNDAPVVSEESSESGPLIQETSAFIADVANLVKLVDSRDIVELELKHKNYEIVIKKKEAVAPPPAPVVQASWPQFSAPVSAPPPPQPAAAAAPVAPSPPPSAPPPAAAAEAAAPSGLPMKSPMAGTFYRSPAPGEPSFVKVGDRVQKGQVICIVEAMKLMNEIEADQSGVITEILANDGSGVAVDTPLFLIAP